MPKHVPNLPGIEPGPYPFSQVVEANGFVFLAGQVGDAPGSLTPPGQWTPCIFRRIQGESSASTTPIAIEPKPTHAKYGFSFASS